MGALPKTTKGNRNPASDEKQHHLAVMELDCMGCGAYPTVAHHPLMQSPLQRWRRDHEFVVPVCGHCHTQIHDVFGNEEKWADANNCQLPVRYAEFLRLESIYAGIL